MKGDQTKRQPRVLFVGPQGLCGISTVQVGVLKIAALVQTLSYQNINTVPYRNGNKAIGYLKLYWRVAVEIRDRDPEIVYLQIAQSGFLHQSLVLLIAKTLGRRTIAHFHAQPKIRATTSPFNFAAIRWSRAYIDQFIVLSKESKEELIGSGFDPTSIQVVPNFLDHRAFPSTPVLWTARKAIVFIGRMTRAKGIFEVLEIAKQMPEEEFVLFGPFESKELQAEFEDQIRGMLNVEWLGPIAGEEKIRAITEAKMTILPSQTEVFPMSVLESSFCHTVSAITKVGMVPEIMDDGVDGLLLLWGDPEYNAERIRALINQPERMMEMAAEANKRARTHYSLEGVQDDIVETIFSNSTAKV